MIDKELLAQDHLSLRDLQAFHQLLDQEKKFDTDMLRNVAYLSEEIGEVVSAIRSFRVADTPSTLEQARTQLGEELADCLAYILKLANYGDVNLEEAYRTKMERNLIRTWHKTCQAERPSSAEEASSKG